MSAALCARGRASLAFAPAISPIVVHRRLHSSLIAIPPPTDGCSTAVEMEEGGKTLSCKAIYMGTRPPTNEEDIQIRQYNMIELGKGGK